MTMAEPQTFKAGDEVEASMYMGGELVDVREGVVVSAGEDVNADGEVYGYSVYVEFEELSGAKWTTTFDPGQLKLKPHGS